MEKNSINTAWRPFEPSREAMAALPIDCVLDEYGWHVPWCPGCRHARRWAPVRAVEVEGPMPYLLSIVPPEPQWSPYPIGGTP